MEDRAKQDELLRRFDRDISTDRHGRVRVRNPAQPYALLGLLAGVLCTAGVALAGRGGFVTMGVLQIVVMLGVALAVLLYAVSLVAGGRGRRAAGVCLGLALSGLLAVFVLAVAASYVIDIDV